MAVVVRTPWTPTPDMAGAFSNAGIVYVLLFLDASYPAGGYPVSPKTFGLGTRILTFMMANGQTNRPYPFIGVPRAHHQISHHQNIPANIADLVTICTWEVSQLAYLIQRLKDVSDDNGSLLDQTLVYFSSELADPNIHMHYNLPVVLAGRCGGAFKPGQHILFPQEVPMGNLFLTIMAALGLNLSQFGMDGTALIPGLG